MATKTKKTFTQLIDEIAHTGNLWPSMTYTLENPFIGARAVVRRRADRAPQTPEERAVTFRATVYVSSAPGGHQRRDITLTMAREETARDNLEVLAQTVEWIRMAHVRKIDSPVVKLLRQLYPEPRPQTPPPPPPPPPRQERVQSSGPHAVLHIADDAPLEVAEAAYRALVKQAHPDVGGTYQHFSMSGMKALNDAIKQIRDRQGR